MHGYNAYIALLYNGYVREITLISPAASIYSYRKKPLSCFMERQRIKEDERPLTSPGQSSFKLPNVYISLQRGVLAAYEGKACWDINKRGAFL